MNAPGAMRGAMRPLTEARVLHLTANTRTDSHKKAPHYRDKLFYDDKLLIVELLGVDGADCTTCSRKNVCRICDLVKGVMIPVEMSETVPDGVSVQLKVFIASQEVEGSSLHIYASNSVTLSYTGTVSCQLNADGIVCNVHFSIELLTHSRYVEEPENDESFVCSTTDNAQSQSEAGSVARLLHRRRYSSAVSTVGLMVLLLALLVHLANESTKAAEQFADKERRLIDSQRLKWHPGEEIYAGGHLSGCLSAQSSANCGLSILVLHRKFVCYYLYLMSF